MPDRLTTSFTAVLTRREPFAGHLFQPEPGNHLHSFLATFWILRGWKNSDLVSFPLSRSLEKPD